MKKYLALSLFAGPVIVFAQSNATIYGLLDTSYAKLSGSDWHMGANHSSRIGFKGVEALSGTLKAHFRIEKRFDLEDGSNGSTGNTNYRGQGTTSSKDYTGAVYVGLSGDFGTLYLGRVEDYMREKIGVLDPFEEDSVATLLYSAQYATRRDNALRYDSPRWNGMQVGLMYMLGKNTKTGGDLEGGRISSDLSHRNIDNDGMMFGVHYDQGRLRAMANFERVPDSDKSYLWNVGLAYQMGPARVSLIYENTHNNGYDNGSYQEVFVDQVGTPKTASEAYASAVTSTQSNWLLGLVYDTGPGDVLASVQYMKLDHVKHLDGSAVLKKQQGTATTDNADVFKYSIGYNYRLSNRTIVYALATYVDFDNNMGGRLYHGVERNDLWGCQLGMTHRF